MKKKLIYGLVSLFLILGGVIIFLIDHPGKQTMPVDAQVDLSLDCEAAYLIEESTGKVIYAQNEEAKMYPASMTKMMGLLLICEQIENGQLKLDDIVTISSEAASMGGSQVFLQPLEQMSVNDLIKCICISSANDAMYAMSEVIGGTNANFVSMMNDKAKQLGCTNTNFVNVTGFDDQQHYTCAKDMAIIAQKLLTHEQLILPYTSTYDSYIRENTDNPFWLVNTNKLVKYYEGMDGLKTGYTTQAGFCLTATAKRNNVRLISVIMKAKSSAIRNKMTTTLLDYGFSKVKAHKLYAEGDILATLKIEKAKSNETVIYAPEDLYFITMNNADMKEIQKEIILKDHLNAPLKKGEVIGQLKVFVAEEVYYYDLILNEDVECLQFDELFKEYLGNILG